MENPNDDNVTAAPPILQWRGNFTNDHSSPPPSIASMVVPLQQQSIVRQNTENECLVASLHNDGHHRPNTSAMVEVIDVTAIMNAWNQQQQQSMNHELTNEHNIDRSLPLEDFIVLPEAGREIMNVFPIINPRQQYSYPTPWNHWIQSRGTNCSIAATTSTTQKSFHNTSDDTNIIAVGHADGMITILDTSPLSGDETTTTTPVWGVSSSHRRYCSSYPCIGIGQIDLSDNTIDNDDTNMSQSYLVCCLRGAATYLIPLVPSSSCSQDDNVPPVLALTVPHDTDDDISIRYTQGFAAANIPLHQRNDDTILPANNSDSLPLLVYVWPGGVIDVYRCGLLPHDVPSTEDQLLKELIANGSVTALRDLILSSQNGIDDDITTNPDWTNALFEIRRHGALTPIHYEDISSDDFKSLKRELLDLNRIEDIETKQ